METGHHGKDVGPLTYLKEHASILALHARLDAWFGRYNDWRPHQAHGNLTPSVIYQTGSGLPTDDSGGSIGKAA